MFLCWFVKVVQIDLFLLMFKSAENWLICEPLMWEVKLFGGSRFEHLLNPGPDQNSRPTTVLRSFIKCQRFRLMCMKSMGCILIGNCHIISQMAGKSKRSCLENWKRDKHW